MGLKRFPTDSRLSKIETSFPAFAKLIAAVRPDTPAPRILIGITITPNKRKKIYKTCLKDKNFPLYLFFHFIN
ncbi:MAG: hypothetical protein HeimC3_55110 [Candidatus Heimdallarchaeota archaeon LC_3]|nr:MAG: hypothetical protein HeimC3_55110 [Candidatus Heimdallarchaeota archaeon LC_3]